MLVKITADTLSELYPVDLCSSYNPGYFSGRVVLFCYIQDFASSRESHLTKTVRGYIPIEFGKG